MRVDREMIAELRACGYGAQQGCPLCCDTLLHEARYQTRMATWEASEIVQMLTLLEIVYRDQGLVAAYRRLQGRGMLT